MIKLASEKSFNRCICPVIKIKGKTVTYPLKVQQGNFQFEVGRGILGPKQMMIMDIIGTKLIHTVYKNQDFSGRIPMSDEKLVKKVSGRYMSAKLLEYVTSNLSPLDKGKIKEFLYDDDGKLHLIDSDHSKIKKPATVVLNDGLLRKELPFLKKYSSKQIEQMIINAGYCAIRMNYPIFFYNGKKYQLFPFDNLGLYSALFSLVNIIESKKSKSGNVLERTYYIKLDTILGYMFMQNIVSSHMDLLPGKFYELTDYAQLYYRIFILSYFKNQHTGKTPKIPLSIDEIRQRLVLKTRDTSTVRKVIKRILTELTEKKFIKGFTEETLDRKYVYRYERTTWKELTKEEESSETDLSYIGN